MEQNKKANNIKELIISAAELKVIYTDISAKNFESFNRLIIEPIQQSLTNWLTAEYPSLIVDGEDLKQGVSRRLKNEIKKVASKETTFPLSKLAHKYLRIECESTLPTSKNIQNNLGLTKVEFKKLVGQLRNGDEQIIEKAYLSHFEKCVATVVKHSSCTQDVAYESTMDALIEIRADLQKDRIRYGNLESYFISRAMNKFYKREKKKKITEQALPDGMEFKDDKASKDGLVDMELNEMVRSAIKQLCKDCQYILHQFYYQDLKMNEIGEQMNKSHQTIRKQASRCRDKLKNYLGEKFYQQFSNHFF